MTQDEGFDVVCPQPGAAKMVVPENWTFESKDVADHFDDHVREQLPWYDLATKGVAHIARHYMPQGAGAQCGIDLPRILTRARRCRH